MNEVLRKSARVVANTGNYGYTIDRPYVDEYMNEVGIIVDYSDSHGECYGLVFPNKKGHYGRKESLEVFWFEPEEIEIL
jgi:hypothetical protein